MIPRTLVHIFPEVLTYLSSNLHADKVDNKQSLSLVCNST